MSKTSGDKIEYQEKVKQAIKLRAAGISYSEIVETLKHWNSISACQKAVATALEKDFGLEVNLAKLEILKRAERRISILMDKFEKNGSVLISREIDRIDNTTAKLLGLFAPTKLAHEGKDGDAEIKTGVRLILPPPPENE